jgi:hypothetical protein
MSLTLEERVQILEEEVSRLKKSLASQPPSWSSSTPSPNVGITFHQEQLSNEVWKNVEPYFKKALKDNTISNADVYFVYAAGGRADIGGFQNKLTPRSIVIICYVGFNKITLDLKNGKAFSFRLNDDFVTVNTSFKDNDTELSNMISYLKANQQIKSCIICGEKAYFVNPSTNQTFCKKTECTNQKDFYSK